MRNFEPILIEQGNIENGLELLIRIITDVRLCPMRLQEIVTLLPDPYRVRLDPGEVLQILYGKRVHVYTTIPMQKSSVFFFRGRNIVIGD